MSKRTTKTKLPAPIGRPAELDPDFVQAIVHRRTAMRWGLPLPVAAAVASLAGLGPDARRV
ncbi:hypothetical protein [Enterovirga rhinocerotis]|uniref:Uncharacterized protein n=1 Tax=Enterovirga rhinocerotis TaxID=1339210 RepID=A0A4R7CEE0_9HYPH|nr:hypothetical protein [Enterovirga rhinocerotis]TDR95672.1 hypothetical protein EV668_0056 [Enterovirga rhinocerotis]